MLEAAKGAYTSAAGTALLVSAAVTILTAVLAMRMFKPRASNAVSQLT